MDSKRPFQFLSILLLLGFWLVTVRHLEIVPPVYEDEPWLASTGWKLASSGVFGSDLFAGFHGMERHYYGFMPVYPLMLAAVFRAAGLGLFQARFVSAGLAILVLALTVALGRRLFSRPVGLLAGLLLMVVPLTTRTPSQYTGIVLADVARIARYDVAVPVFGLLALHAGWSAADRPQPALAYALAGFLSGLAALSHLYGAFWLIALLALAVWQRAGRGRIVALLFGFGLPWLPYLAYVLGSPADWAGQMRGYGPRFGLLDPSWYAANLLAEPRRYTPGLGPAGWSWLQRPGFWFTLVAVPGALLALGRRAWRGDRGAAWLFVPALLLPALMALLITLKLSNYLVTIVPLFALAAAWGAAALWRRAAVARAGQLAWRGLLLLALLAVVIEGIGRLRQMEQAAARTTPYPEFIAQVRPQLPAGAAVLGLHNYWLGLEDFTYWSWTAPLLLSEEAGGRPLEEYLSGYRPDAILVDRRMRDFFNTAPEMGSAIRGWMDRWGYALAAAVDDPTYGRLEIYR